MRAAAFRDFVEAVHGYQPFPWQQRLAEQVIDGEGWPPVIAAPTAAGKTAVIDLAVFALAASIGFERRHPRRIFFVIDRRVVVDAAYERARKITDALAAGDAAIVREVADRLRESGGEVPLLAAVLRGGLPLDRSWARSPLQPVVCVSTVDQVGSRLLFRGYGLSRGTTNLLPIDAGLVGNDALIILDEAHLSGPFQETLEAIGMYRKQADSRIQAPWEVVHMTATPRPDGDERFSIASADRKHPILGRRLLASKPARLVVVGTHPKKSLPRAELRRLEVENAELLVRSLCEEARSITHDDPVARVVAVVVNRVATAREVHRILSSEAVAILLTGRTRPFDRDRLLERYRHRIFAGRVRDPAAPLLFVVATQAVEVGADLDFDGLVTECASLDALRQRFGRLDRLGERGKSRGAIVARADQTAKGAEEDRVYGPALAETWRWLGRMAKSSGGKRKPAAVDMGVAALRIPAGKELVPLLPPVRHAPVMLPAHLDLFTQTSPIPRPDPDVGVFLHGPETEPPDVVVVWRADLNPDDRDRWADIVALAPPVAAEGLPVPAYAARAWLGRAAEADIADVEGARATYPTAPPPGRPALRWRGRRSDDTRVINPSEISPGDVLVVPAAYGGADEYGWDPSSGVAVEDVGDQVRTAYRKRVNLRLHPRLVLPGIPEAGPGVQAAVRDALGRLATAVLEDERGEAVKAETECLEALAALGGNAWLGRAAAGLLADDGRRRTPYPDGRGVAVEGIRRVETGPVLTVLTDTDDTSSFLGIPVRLEDHCTGVAEEVRILAEGCGLPDSIRDDLVRAARSHDLGKADPRFQVMLRGGDELEALADGKLLAKSGMDPRDRVAFLVAFRASGLPSGYRHEATSLALIETQLALLEGTSDPELVRHLIASHHGAARPFLPAATDEERTVTLRWDGFDLSASTQHRFWQVGSGVAERFWSLVERYGWFELAYLEAIFRLADHRRSEFEAGPGGPP